MPIFFFIEFGIQKEREKKKEMINRERERERLSYFTSYIILITKKINIKKGRKF